LCPSAAEEGTVLFPLGDGRDSRVAYLMVMGDLIFFVRRDDSKSKYKPCIISLYLLDY
jgi:hypothetical protein